MVYQRVEYRIKLCDNSDEEYRTFRDSMREHLLFRQKLIDEGIDSVSEYKPPKKPDADKPTASPDNTKPETSENAAKRYVAGLNLLQADSHGKFLGRRRTTSSKNC